MVNKMIWAFLLLGIISIPATALSVEFVWKDKKGIMYFKCDASGTSGHAKVKQIGLNTYRVFGGNFKGDVEVMTPEEAAKKACGE